jgi:hypothetical protein
MMQRRLDWTTIVHTLKGERSALDRTVARLARQPNPIPNRIIAREPANVVGRLMREGRLVPTPDRKGFVVHD